jgi:redox-sensing transcriptional repressor
MINRACIIRLSRYRQTLIRLKTLNFVKVFSENLANSAGITAMLVRKDFSLIGISGNKRGGYQIDDLITVIDNILGKDKIQKFVVIGIGNIGRALLNYPNFKQIGIELAAGFDVDTAKHNRENAIPILPVDELGKFVKKNSIRFGIISVPEAEAQNTLEIMVQTGIKGILNFAPICLKEQPGCIVNNLHLETEIENIIYFTNAEEKARSLNV